MEFNLAFAWANHNESLRFTLLEADYIIAQQCIYDYVQQLITA